MKLAVSNDAIIDIEVKGGCEFICVIFKEFD